jgi:hypothetical protein
MSTADPTARAREQFREDVGAVVKQLQAIQAAARDKKGESLGLLVARLSEAQERLEGLVESSRKAVAELQG